MCIRFLGSICIVKGLCEENYTDRNMQLAGVINYYLIFHPLVFSIKLISSLLYLLTPAYPVIYRPS